MYFRIEKSQNIIRVENNFASLKKVHDDGSLEFEFLYSIRQSDAIRKSTKVEVTVLSRNIDKNTLETSFKYGKIDTVKLAYDILTDVTRAKTAKRNQDNYVICKKISDVSAFINNSSVDDVRKNKTSQAYLTKKVKLVPAGDLKKSNDNKPILHRLLIEKEKLNQKTQTALRENVQSLNFDLICRQGVDPSNVSLLSSKVTNSNDAVQGIRKETLQKNEIEPISRLYDYFSLYSDIVNKLETDITGVPDSRLVGVVSDNSSDVLSIPVNIKFFPPERKISSIESTNLLVRFELIDQISGIAIETVDKSLDIYQLIDIYETPTTPPIVKISNSNFSKKATLEISQVDDAANEIFLYKKLINISSSDADEYRLVDNFPLQKKQKKTISVTALENNPVIYRCIPAKNGNLCGSFTNIIVKPLKYKPIKNISLSSKIEKNGVTLEARGFAPNIVSVQFLYRNLTTHSKKFENISEPILVEQKSVITLPTTDVIDDHVYEFAVKALFKDGTSEILDNEIIEFNSPNPGKVDLKINNFQVEKQNEIDVKFDVSLQEIDNDITDIKILLENQGIKDYFDEDIKRQRDDLQKLLTYSVHRVNLNTGEREDMGFVAEKTFSDKTARGKLASKPLVQGHGYRYTVTASSRITETVFEKLNKKVFDENSKKSYRINPSKFLHPIALKRGIITTPNGRKSLFAKTAFEHGKLGVTLNHEIEFQQASVSISNANLHKFDSDKNIITWKVTGDIKLIDHFLILKEIHGTREIVGTAHSQFSANSCSWIDKSSKNDNAQVRYVIVSILNNYKIGQEIITNYFSAGAT